MTYTIRAFPVFLSVTLALVSGCAGPEVFEKVGATESADVAATPYPRLADVTAPAPGPDPAKGDAVLIELGTAASNAEVQLESVSGPVE